MKKILSILMIIAIPFALFGCGKKPEVPDNIDIRALSDVMIDGLEFGGELEECPSDVAVSNYGLNENLCSEIIFYRAGSAVADELAIFKAANASAVSDIEKSVKDRIEYLNDGYSDYKPSEVPKIEKALVKTVGNVVIMCISESPYKKAETIVTDYFIKTLRPYSE